MRERASPAGELNPVWLMPGRGGYQIQERNLMSPRTDRLSSAMRDRGKHLVAAGADRMASTFRGHTKSLAYVGTALAAAGVGSTLAAGTASAATTPPAKAAASHAAASHTAAGHAAVGAPSATSASVSALPSIAALTSIRHPLPATPLMSPTPPSAGHAASKPQVVSWVQVRNAINAQTDPASARVGQLPASGQLMPAGTTGPQSWMPISPAQLSNATAIVKQALAKRMGIRAAVVGVATSMQESRLLNLHYGDLDSLGLFQQRPSMGWGTAAQLTDPSYAANAFLTALRQHQAGDPGWASQPLWASAQAVQKSGFPFAYAKWESQAAGLVKQIAMQVR
jgi:hypothetical protein